eukprot:921634-Amphidinium_carterae.1
MCASFGSFCDVGSVFVSATPPPPSAPSIWSGRGKHCYRLLPSLLRGLRPKHFKQCERVSFSACSPDAPLTSPGLKIISLTLPTCDLPPLLNVLGNYNATSPPAVLAEKGQVSSKSHGLQAQLVVTWPA